MMTLPDAAARRLVEAALQECLLVEAGAGSGKTTALVGRMVALVRDAGVDVERIAAVTFTRKAAGELRERFQAALEAARREARDPAPLDQALQSMDRAFMGTIHAFCARLLRERPLEAGIDPAFRELTASEEALLASRWWAAWLERLAVEADPALAGLADVGVEPHRLEHAFAMLNEHSDVVFPLEEVPRPLPTQIAQVRAALEELMDRAERIFPHEEPEKGWDGLMGALRTAWFRRRTVGWKDDCVFLDTLTLVHSNAGRVTQNRWRSDGHFTAKVLKEAFAAWAEEGSPATRLVTQWLEHRHPIAVGFALRAAAEFGRFRRRTGQLTFHDLLSLSAELLRGSDDAREDLGARYRHILVDEFQDTDPLQAEVLFLLTGEVPENEEDGADGRAAAEVASRGSAGESSEVDWRSVVPRPGALFVVGDPKQSIYRFRRADISLYQQVRDRFDGATGGFGEVVELTSNFRSGPPIAALVNHVFEGDSGFPQVGTSQQAPFAPLQPARTDPGPTEGTYLVDVPEPPDPSSKGRGAEWEAEASALAGWIAGRIGRGERRAGDFLILTRTKRALAIYARALEAHNVAVDVSGAGVGIEEEVRELRAVLEALSDPDDPVKTVTALTGLFFGLDLDQLLRYRESGGGRPLRFDFRYVDVPAARATEGVTPGTTDRGEGASARPTDQGGGPGAAIEVEAVQAVREALGTLRAWWIRSRELPADTVVAELVSELGLLPYAAAGELGQIRAGALGFAMEAVRAAGLEGDTSLVGALDALQTALDEDEVEAPLQPGRPDTVRVMNLHKAKGLEAPVVVLADPHDSKSYPPELIIERSLEGPPHGYLRVGERGRYTGQFHTLARPPRWEELEAAEGAFSRAEEVRLLYVACTRAAEELVVTRLSDAKRAGKSSWAPLHRWLDAEGVPLVLGATSPPERATLEVGAPEMLERAEAAVARRQRLGAPGYAFDTVTARARQAEDQVDAVGIAEADSAATDGASVDSGVAATETRTRYRLSLADSTGPGGFEWGNAVHAVLEAAGRGVEGRSLRDAARTALIENDRPLQGGEPTELDTLLSLVEGVRHSELWRRAEQAELDLAEHPFVIEDEDGRFLEGVIDRVFREPDGWVVVDYKTDREGTPPPERAAAYRRQVQRYAAAWARLTGEDISEAQIWWLSGEAPPEPDQ